MVYAWIQMQPSQIKKEIKTAMVVNGITERRFHFKTLTPVYQRMKARITDPDHFKELEWKYSDYAKQENEVSNAVKLVLNEFKLYRNYERDDIMRKFSTLPINFTDIHSFLDELVFGDTNRDANLKIPGNLWLSELFLKSQIDIV